MVLFTAISSTVHSATLSGVGARLCGEFVAHVNNQEETVIDSFVSWAQGFISGANWNADADMMIDVGSMNHWLVDYCNGKPKVRFYEAVSEMVKRNR